MEHRSVRAIFRLSIFLLLVLLLSACLAMPPQEVTRAGIPLDPLVETGVLDNGLTWYIRKNAEPENRASLRLVVNAGSILEEDDQRGLAHLVEHMAFNGTENFEKHELIDYLESIGMAFGPEINAYTGFDETVYMLEIPTDNREIIETAFQVLEDWAHLISFEEEEIDAERGVVQEEWRLGRGAQGRILDAYLPVLLEGSRYSERLPIGKMDVVMGAPYDRITDFYHTWYRPDLMAVIAVGDFDTAFLKELIKKHFSFKGPKLSVERQYYQVPEHRETKALVIRDPELPSAQVELTVKHPPGSYRTEDDYRTYLVQSLSFSMFNDRLAEKARETDPPFVAASAGSSTFLRFLELESYSAVTDVASVLKAVEVLAEEIRALKELGFTRTELERKKAEYLRFIENAYRERDNLDSSSLAGELTEYYLKDIFMPGIDEEYRLFNRMIPEITLAEVNRRAEELFPQKNRVLTAILPEDGPVIDKDDLPAAVKRGETAPLTAYEDESLETPLVEKAPKAGKVIATEDLENLDATLLTLSNGARVILKPTDFRNDEILFEAFSPGGLSLVEDEDYVSGQYAPLLLTESGLGNYTAVQLEKRLAGLDVQVSPYIGDLGEGLSGGGSPEHLEEIFQLIYLHFTAPQFRQEAFQNVTNRLASLVSRRELDPDTVFSDTLNDLVTAGDFRSKPLTTERLELIDLDRSQAVYRDRFGDPGDFTFVFVGSFDTRRITPLLETWIASLPAKDTDETVLDRGMRPYYEGIEAVVERGTEDKGRVGLAFAGELDTWEKATEAVTGALESVLDITLREKIREELSGTYGASVRISAFPLPYPGYTSVIHFGCDPDRSEELTGEVLKVIKTLQDGDIPEETLLKVREHYRRQYEEGMKRNNFWLNHLTGALRWGMDLEPAITPEEYATLVTGEAVAKAAREALPVERYVRVFLLPERVPAQP
ncbi:MAG: insulinase family protein [Spirochaetales bacterium]|nr:insulinase family protein [Spirochaetales bacterium]